MHRRFKNFIRGLSADPFGTVGVALTTSALVMFLLMELLRVLGWVTSSYVGLITYLLFPVLFILGLLLIPIGWARYRRRRGKSTKELLAERFSPEEFREGVFGSRLLGTFLVLTAVNLVFLGAGTTRMLHFMEKPVFCGTACHSVMGPEWATYQASPHAHVRCVDCHVGEGAGALIDSKINGMYQMISVTFDLYERPIPTPVHQLRPARETCEKCHWPEKFYGNRLLEKVRYGFDEANTPRYSTLSLKVGSGSGERRGEIHWHVASRNEVRYVSIDDQREQILWVESRQPDGSWKRYQSRTLAEKKEPSEAARTMDCVDCHNRATHIYQDPEDAVDAAITAGKIDRSIPHIKAQALAAITRGYPDMDAAMRGIDNSLFGYYRQNAPERFGEFSMGLDDAVEALRAIYRRNIHPGMNIGWGAYSSHLGHRQEGGCFRCHHRDMVDEQGVAVGYDCTLCHSILAQESEHPFQFLMPLQEKGDPDFKQHRYLQQEFLQTLQ